MRLAATVAIDHPTIAALAAAVAAARGEVVVEAPRAALAPLSPPSNTVTAIVGMASRHPGVGIGPFTTTAGAPFHHALSSTRDVATRVPADRWDADAHFAPAPRPFKSYVNAAGWLAGVDAFDGAAFRVPPAEAAAMDPQARVLLECVKVRIGWGGEWLGEEGDEPSRKTSTPNWPSAWAFSSRWAPWAASCR